MSWEIKSRESNTFQLWEATKIFLIDKNAQKLVKNCISVFLTKSINNNNRKDKRKNNIKCLIAGGGVILTPPGHE